MKQIKKQDLTIYEPFEFKAYSVLVDGEDVARFNNVSVDHPVTSRDVYYDNLIAYYTRMKIDFKEVL
jgi:hypothetical protein